MLACEGKVQGAVDRAPWNTTPRVAICSRLGVVGRLAPKRLRLSARTLSRTIKSTLGAVGEAAGKRARANRSAMARLAVQTTARAARPPPRIGRLTRTSR